MIEWYKIINGFFFVLEKLQMQIDHEDDSRIEELHIESTYAYDDSF